MAQITWRNVNTPNFGSANQLALAGQEQLTAGLDTLRGLAQEQTDLANTNYQTGVEQNTGALQQAINQATTQDELDAIDTTQYGAQVDPSAIAASLGARTDTLNDRATEQEKIGIQRQKLALEQKVAGQPTIRDDNNGTIWALDPNTGEPVSQTHYTKKFAPRKGTGGSGANSQLAKSYGAYATSKVKDFTDRAAYQTAMTDYVNQNPDIDTATGNKLVQDSMVNYDSYYTLGAEDQILVDQQNSANNIATTAYNDAIQLNSGKLDSALGFPAEALNYAEDESLSLTDAQKNWSDKFDSFGNGNFSTAYAAMTDVLGHAPNGKEFDYLMAQTDQDSIGFITQSDIKDNAQKYKDNILESIHRKELEDYSAKSAAIENMINNRTTQASANTERAIRNRKAGGKAATITNIDMSGLDDLTTSIDSLILKIGDEKAKGFTKITGFEK